MRGKGRGETYDPSSEEIKQKKKEGGEPYNFGLNRSEAGCLGAGRHRVEERGKNGTLPSMTKKEHIGEIQAASSRRGYSFKTPPRGRTGTDTSCGERDPQGKSGWGKVGDEKYLEMFSFGDA